MTILNSPSRANDHFKQAISGVGYQYETAQKLQLKEIVESNIDGIQVIVEDDD